MPARHEEDQDGAIPVVRAQRRGRGSRPDDRGGDAAVHGTRRRPRAGKKSAGAWVFGGALHDPDTATVARVSDNEVLTTDGPFAESKEHLGGFYVIEADDLDAALAWASKTTAAVSKPIEVRPFRHVSEA